MHRDFFPKVRVCIDLPSCEDDLDVLCWLKVQVGLQELRKACSKGMEILLNGNDPIMVLHGIQKIIPHAQAMTSDEEKMIFQSNSPAVHKEKPEVTTGIPLSEDNRFIVERAKCELGISFPHKLLYGLDILALHELSLLHQQIPEAVMKVDKNYWQRRDTRGQDKTGLRGSAGEVLLDLLVRKAIERLRTRMRQEINSPIFEDKKKRDALALEANTLLRSNSQFIFAENGCCIHDRKSGDKRFEYENAIYAKGNDGLALLLLDATTGKSDGKLKKATKMKSHHVRTDKQHQIHALSIVFRDANYYIGTQKIALPIHDSIQTLLDSRTI